MCLIHDYFLSLGIAGSFDRDRIDSLGMATTQMWRSVNMHFVQSDLDLIFLIRTVKLLVSTKWSLRGVMQPTSNTTIRYNIVFDCVFAFWQITFVSFSFSVRRRDTISFCRICFQNRSKRSLASAFSRFHYILSQNRIPPINTWTISSLGEVERVVRRDGRRSSARRQYAIRAAALVECAHFTARNADLLR